MKPKISIIIPHYNSVKELKKLLKSIPDKKELEIIVIDDNSQWNLYNETELKLDFPNVIFLKNNLYKKGAGAARNIGIMNSNGEWIIFADSDDFFLKDSFEIIMKDLEDEVDIVYYRPTSVYIDTLKEANRHKKYSKLIEKYFFSKEEKYLEQLKYKFIVPWSKVIKRRLIVENNIKFEEIIASNDVMFSTLLGTKIERIKVSLEQIYCVTLRKGSLTQSFSEEIFDSRLDTLIRVNTYLREIKKEKYQHQVFFLLLKNRKLGIKKILEALKKLRNSKISLFIGIYEGLCRR